MELRGSKTEQNLLAGFSGESMARTRYSIYASRAKAEGYEQIAEIFSKTAENEKEHAKMMLKFLDGVGDTEKNLKAAAYGEHEEWSKIYKEAEEVAAKEGFQEIAAFFRNLGDVEAEHEERYLTLLEGVQQGKTFSEDKPVKWICRNCGYVYEGENAPEVCPVCRHPKAYFERKAENY